jgi:hypothetical protein
MKPWLGLSVASLAAVLAGCGGETPEAEIRSLVAAAEEAAEARDTGFFRDLIAPGYVDPKGQHRDDLIDLLRAHFLVNRDLEILNRIDDIRLSGDEAAEVVLQTAMIGRDGAGPGFGLDGAIYRIELELVKTGGEWHLIGADWSRILD